MLKIIFPVVAIVGLFLLIRSVLRLSKTFTSNQQEFAASLQETILHFDKIGEYEIDVKRPSITGMVSFNSTFEVKAKGSGQNIPVRKSNNIFAGRKDMSGTRIIPIAHFIIDEPGDYLFRNLSTTDFKNNDSIAVMPKVGMKGALAILATVFSGLLFIGGVVLTLLAFRGKI